MGNEDSVTVLMVPIAVSDERGNDATQIGFALFQQSVSLALRREDAHMCSVHGTSCVKAILIGNTDRSCSRLAVGRLRAERLMRGARLRIGDVVVRYRRRAGTAFTPAMWGLLTRSDARPLATRLRNHASSVQQSSRDHARDRPSQQEECQRTQDG
jgi:hypothetical protein